MTDRAHYRSAPIAEATIELRIAPAQQLSIDNIAAMQEMVGDRYPHRESEYIYSGQVHVEEAGDPLQVEPSQWHNGFRFISQDKRQIFYARLDGFAFSVLAPYERWETFRDEARRLWDLYRSVTKAESVTRAAVRYINQINVVSYASDPTNVQLQDYVRVHPTVPPDWSSGVLRNFFMQLQLWQEDLDCWLILNETPVLPPGQEVNWLQLDFDFFREEFENPWRADDDTAVWEFLERLHDRKNEAFEASITEETRRFIR